jgi:hypothetical protein
LFVAAAIGLLDAGTANAAQTLACIGHRAVPRTERARTGGNARERRWGLRMRRAFSAAWSCGALLAVAASLRVKAEAKGKEHATGLGRKRVR